MSGAGGGAGATGAATAGARGQKRRRPSDEPSAASGEQWVRSAKARYDGPVHDDVQALLEEWFEHYGANKEVEIEARVKGAPAAGISQSAFEHVVAQLESNQEWTNSDRNRLTVDYAYKSGVRATHKPGKLCHQVHLLPSLACPQGIADCTAPPVEFMRKGNLRIKRDVQLGKSKVRWSLQSEEAASAPPSYDSVNVVRIKHRLTFVRKNEFAYELTSVQQGSTYSEALKASKVFEVELEFCGQGKYKARPSGSLPTRRAARLAKSMLGKVEQVIDLVLA